MTAIVIATPAGASSPEGTGKAIAPPIFSKLSDFQELLTLRRNFFQTFAVSKIKGFEFYRKIIELGPAALQVPRHSCAAKKFSNPL